MLEFIILGLVPGTSFQITIEHVTTFTWLSFLGYMFWQQRTKNADQS